MPLPVDETCQRSPLPLTSDPRLASLGTARHVFLLLLHSLTTTKTLTLALGFRSSAFGHTES